MIKHSTLWKHTSFKYNFSRLNLTGEDSISFTNLLLRIKKIKNKNKQNRLKPFLDICFYK